MTPPRIAPLAGLALLAALAPVAQADILVGHVVDSNGAPVAAVNIDIEEMLSGDDVALSNDSTDANGDFAIDVPPGLYRLILVPPPPPVTTHLIASFEDVVVIGFTDVGTLELTPGYGFLGRVVGPANQALEDVDLDIIDLETHAKLRLKGDDTDSQGAFAIAVPRGPFEVRYDPQNANGGPFAPRANEFDLAQDTNIGTVKLEPGLVVSMTVIGPSGRVQGADVDVMDSATGEKLYTPGDDTDGNGDVDLVVPAGTYDIEICPPFSERLVAEILVGLVLNSDQDLGTISLTAGVVLSGNVDDPFGKGLGKVDLNVFEHLSGIQVPTCADDTNSAGDYAIVVPQGEFDVKFRPPFTEKVGALEVTLTISGNTILDASLPACDCGTPSGRGVVGSGGFLPRIRARGGPLRAGNTNWGVRLDRGLGGALGLVVMSAGNQVGGGPPPPGGQPGPFGGLLRQVQTVVVQLKGTNGLPGAGHRLVSMPIPKDSSLVGLSMHTRAVIRDPGAGGGMSITRALVGIACD